MTLREGQEGACTSARNFFSDVGDWTLAGIGSNTSLPIGDPYLCLLGTSIYAYFFFATRLIITFHRSIQSFGFVSPKAPSNRHVRAGSRTSTRSLVLVLGAIRRMSAFQASSAGVISDWVDPDKLSQGFDPLRKQHGPATGAKGRRKQSA